MVEKKRSHRGSNLRLRLQLLGLRGWREEQVVISADHSRVPVGAKAYLRRGLADWGAVGARDKASPANGTKTTKCVQLLQQEEITSSRGTCFYQGVTVDRKWCKEQRGRYKSLQPCGDLWESRWLSSRAHSPTPPSRVQKGGLWLRGRNLVAGALASWS